MKKTNWQKFWLALGIGFGIIFLSAFITSQVIFPLLFGKPKNVEVPNLVGMSFSRARRNLTELGLHAVIKDSIWSETEMIETILEQDPQPGERLKPEGTVYLRVSSGSKQVGVPSVIGLSFHEAYYTLHNVGLKGVVADSLYSDAYAVNNVIRCVPEVGSKIERGSNVRLYLSRGPEPVPELLAPESAPDYEDPDYLY
ncbi:MAG: PASTA domain-containing protein [Candidatus Syntrophosphaera sp.]|nr:PASTA domain-containing protein [Candidatus Syntrophosphaera sp.]